MREAELIARIPVMRPLGEANVAHSSRRFVSYSRNLRVASKEQHTDGAYRAKKEPPGTPSVAKSAGAAWSRRSRLSPFLHRIAAPV